MRQELFGVTRRALAVLAVPALMLSWVVATPGTASASTGGAARGAGITGEVGAVTVDSITVLPGLAIDEAIADTPAPDGDGNGSDSATVAPLSLGGGLVTADSVNGDTVRTTDSLQASASVSAISLNFFTIPIVEASLLSSSVRCPITQLPDEDPVADVDDVLGLTFDGAPGTVGVPSDPIPVDIGNPDATAYIIVTVTQPTLVTATTAEATGLRIQATLHVELLGVPIDFDLVDVSLAKSECERPVGTAPVSSTLAPLSGTELTTVTVTGSGFIPDHTTVNFGSTTIPATAVTVSGGPTDYGTFLTFQVPDDAPLGPTSVTATTPVGTSTPVLSFDVTPAAPTTLSLDPTSGGTGTVVTVTGDNFIPGATSVDFGAITIPAGEVTVAPGGDSLTFEVPSGAPLGDTDVTVTTLGGTSTPALSFTVLPAPSSTSLDPTTGPEGTSVTVTGDDFMPGATSVQFGDLTIPTGSVEVASSTSLTFGVPDDAPLGDTPVVVVTPGGQSDPLSFTVTPAAPVATGLTPPSGPEGTVVEVDGDNFIPGATTVLLGSTTIAADAVAVAADGNSLTFVVPDDTPVGSTTVVVTTDGGSTTPLVFTVTVAAPVIGGISPAEGPAGTTVTVTGDNFVPGGTTVAIGGVVVAAADVTVAPDGDSLTFVVPEGAVLGANAVSVTTVGGTSGAVTFTVTDGSAVVPVNPSGVLPYTGSGSSGPMTLAGLTLLLSGAGLVLAATMARRRPAPAAVVHRGGQRRRSRL